MFGKRFVAQVLSVWDSRYTQPSSFFGIRWPAVVRCGSRGNGARGQEKASVEHRHIEHIVGFFTGLSVSGGHCLVPAMRVLAFPPEHVQGDFRFFLSFTRPFQRFLGGSAILLCLCLLLLSLNTASLFLCKRFFSFLAILLLLRQPSLPTSLRHRPPLELL